MTGDNVRWFSDIGLGDLEDVGGKNSSLGEMISNPRRRRGERARRVRHHGLGLPPLPR